MRMRTVRAVGIATRVRVGGAEIYFDESRGYLATVAEDVAEELVERKLATIPSAADLCRGKFLLRRRAGLGDVLCLLPVVREIQRLGGEVAVACHPRFAPVWDGVAPLAQRSMPGYESVVFDGVLENHPGRPMQCAAQCYADRWNIDLSDAKPTLELTPNELAWGKERAETLRGNGKRLVAVFTAAGWGTRRYRGLLKVSAALAKEGHAIVGFDTVLPCCHKAPEDLSARELAAFVAACDLVVCNDSGPLHVAAAVGTKTVAVFCATSAAGSVGPGYDCVPLEPQGLDCWPCWYGECDKPRCVWGVEPKEVYAAAITALA